jgi:hypothetical protein
MGHLIIVPSDITRFPLVSSNSLPFLLTGDIEDQTAGAGQIGRRYFAVGYFAQDKPDPMNDVCERFRMGTFSSGAYRPLTSPDLLDCRVASA